MRGSRVIIMALLIALVITVSVVGVGLLLTRETTAPTIAKIDPADGSSVTIDNNVVVRANYGDNRAVDTKSVRLVFDGRDVTAQSLVSDTSASYPAGILDPGLHVVLLELSDTSGNKASRGVAVYDDIARALPHPHGDTDSRAHGDVDRHANAHEHANTDRHIGSGPGGHFYRQPDRGRWQHPGLALLECHGG